MTRDDLEAIIWQNMPVTSSFNADAARVEAILAAADQYAAYTGGITAERRAELARPHARPTARIPHVLTPEGEAAVRTLDAYEKWRTEASRA